MMIEGGFSPGSEYAVNWKRDADEGTPTPSVRPIQTERAGEVSVKSLLSEANDMTSVADRHWFGKKKGEAKRFEVSRQGKDKLDQYSDALKNASLDYLLNTYDELMSHKEGETPLTLQEKAVMQSMLGIVKTRLRFRVHDILEGGQMDAEGNGERKYAYKQAMREEYDNFMQSLAETAKNKGNKKDKDQFSNDDLYLVMAQHLQGKNVDYYHGKLRNAKGEAIVFKTQEEKIREKNSRRWALTAGVGVVGTVAAVAYGPQLKEIASDFFSIATVNAANATPAEYGALKDVMALATAEAGDDKKDDQGDKGKGKGNGKGNGKKTEFDDVDEIRAQQRQWRRDQLRGKDQPVNHESTYFGKIQFVQSPGQIIAPEVTISAQKVVIGATEVQVDNKKGFTAILQPHRYENTDGEKESPQSDGPKITRKKVGEGKYEVTTETNAYRTSDGTGFDFIKGETTNGIEDAILEMHSRNVKKGGVLIPHPGEGIRMYIDGTAGKVSKLDTNGINMVTDQLSGTIVRMVQTDEQGNINIEYAMMMVDRLPPDLVTKYYTDRGNNPIRALVNEARQRRNQVEGRNIPALPGKSTNGEIWARICGNRTANEKRETKGRGDVQDIIDWEQAILVTQFVRLTEKQALGLYAAQLKAQKKGQYISREELEDFRAKLAD